MINSRRVLIIGIVLTDKANLAARIAQELAASKDWSVDQTWIAIGKTAFSDPKVNIIERLESGEPKFTILNRILSETQLDHYDYVIVTDDDIELPASFLDKYLELVGRYDFALAQPARTHDSYIDHHFVEQLDGITARQTRYVEIGPLFSMRTDAIGLLTPFDLISPMGWGYDFTWALTMEAAGLKIGIVDDLPVSHKLRKPVSNYVHADADQQMKAYLSNRAYLKKEDAFLIVESFC